MLARSRAIDLYRKKAKLQARVDQPIAAEELPETATSPQHDATMKEFRRFAESALDAITAEERAVIELSVFEGMSHAQIANCVDSPLGTVKSHIRRGLEKLRQKLKQWEV